MVDDNLLDQILKILTDRDPMGIDFGMDNNEYKAEAKAISEKLIKGMGKEELLEIVYQVFVSWFGEGTAGEKSKYLAITEDILKLVN